MQRLASFRQCAWRCESRSLPNASPQRHNTHTHTIFLFTDTGTHCLLLLPANPQQQQQHNLLWVVLQPFQTGHSFACLSSYMLLPAVFDFCFSRKDTDQHCSKILYDESRSFDQKKGKKTMSALVHTLRPSLSSWSQCVWGKQSVRFDFLTT